MSSRAWIDFDEAEPRRAQRIMALFQERETRDELGLEGESLQGHVQRIDVDALKLKLVGPAIDQ